MASTAIAKSYSNSNNDNSEEEIYFTIPSIEELKTCLEDNNAPIAKRMRTVFLLKQLSTLEAIDILCNSLSDKSVLLAHECAYVLGQIQNPSAIPKLTQYLSDQTINSIVRHECAEALAAIGEYDSINILSKFLSDPSPEVRETCEIAVEKLKYQKQILEEKKLAAEKKELSTELIQSKYASVDPAPPVTNMNSVSELKSLLLNISKSLFERYRAMFSLRDIGTDEAVEALASGFDDKSAVFRHEIAYVMGQMQNPTALSTLTLRLKDNTEHPMVRHEAAEAIGSIAETDCEPMLKGFAQDNDEIVRQSCDVALDLVDYWNNDQIESALPQQQDIEFQTEKNNKTTDHKNNNNSTSTKSITEGIATIAFVRKTK